MDQEIIQKALQGDASAWKTLLADHGGRMYSIALRFLSNEREAEDAVQEAWIQISQKLADFRGEARLGTWIYRITANRCLEKLRSRKRSRTDSLEDLVPQYIEDGHYVREFADWSAHPGIQTDQQLLKEMLHEALCGLPDEAREVLVLRDVEGFSGAETAAMLGIPEAAMKTRLHRARMALREKLERKLGPSPWDALSGRTV